MDMLTRSPRAPGIAVCVGVAVGATIAGITGQWMWLPLGLTLSATLVAAIRLLC